MSDPKFPRGKLREDDEGELTVAFTVKDGTIVIAFGKPICWIGFGANDARTWAAKLTELADRIEQ